MSLKSHDAKIIYKLRFGTILSTDNIAINKRRMELKLMDKLECSLKKKITINWN